MCNACGNYCCGSDEFGQCGCDGCPEPECWSDDFDEDDDAYLPDMDCACRRQSPFECVQTTGAA